jgi:hypothetical protein
MSSQEPGPAEELTAAMIKIAQETGGTLRIWPRPGAVVRRVVLRDDQDEHGSQLEIAQLESDGTLRVTGHDQGQPVSDFFGPDITSYEWVYVIEPDRVASLVALLGAHDGDDVLALLAAYHRANGGAISSLLKHPDVAGELSTWHS